MKGPAEERLSATAAVLRQNGVWFCERCCPADRNNCARHTAVAPFPEIVCRKHYLLDFYEGNVPAHHTQKRIRHPPSMRPEAKNCAVGGPSQSETPLPTKRVLLATMAPFGVRNLAAISLQTKISTWRARIMVIATHMLPPLICACS